MSLVVKRQNIMNGIIYFDSSIINLGDYIQSLSASKYFDNFVFVDRENVSKYYSQEKTYVIMNAWWMWSSNWPPSPCIHPLYVSVHISPNASWMLSEDSVKHFKQFEPIGCRDIGTQRLLQSKGLQCYFSGCLTLTLGKKSGYDRFLKTGKIVICDPYYDFCFRTFLSKRCNPFSIVFCIIKNYSFFHSIRSKFGYWHKMFNVKNKYIKIALQYFQMSVFWQSYTTLFSEELLKGADYTSHLVNRQNLRPQDSLALADSLVRQYAHAKMIITSRIHCGLPSLGCGTPVLFVTSSVFESRTEEQCPDRIQGLVDLFHIVRYDRNNNKLDTPQTLNLTGLITGDTEFSNKKDYESYRDSLIAACESFTKNI